MINENEIKPKKKSKNWLWVIGVIVLLIIISAGGGEEETTQPAKETVSQNEEKQTEDTQTNKIGQVDEIKIDGKIIKIGDSADDVFQTVTDKYKIDSPTIKNGKVIHHFLDDKTLFDMTFEKNETDSYYVLTEIVVKDRNYQAPEQEDQSPVEYEIGYISGALAAISVPKGTTEKQLRELLSYFHLLKVENKLSRVMKGHTVIDIFDDKKWTIKENYNNIILSTEAYCNSIKATYSVDINGVERASIGFSECLHYEEIMFQ